MTISPVEQTREAYQKPCRKILTVTTYDAIKHLREIGAYPHDGGKVAGMQRCVMAVTTTIANPRLMQRPDLTSVRHHGPVDERNKGPPLAGQFRPHLLDSLSDIHAVSVIRIWSSKGRSSNSPAFFSRSVSFQSASLAWELPPGWLWARMNEAAPAIAFHQCQFHRGCDASGVAGSKEVRNDVA
jgi:hypothetical protein